MRRFVIGLAVVAGLGLVLSVGGRLVGGSDRVEPTPAPATPIPPVSTSVPAAIPRVGEAEVLAGVTVPAGYSHDVAGATAAAVSLVELSSQLVDRSEDDVAAVQAAISAAATRTQLVDSNRAKIRSLRAAFPDGGLTWRIAALASRIAPHSADAVQVAVWRVGVLTTPTGQVTQEWAIVTLELVWEDGRWRVLSEQSTPGPVPAAPGLVPSGAAELDARLAGFSTADVDS